MQGALSGLGENVSPQYAINGGGFSLLLRQASLEAGAASGAVPGVPLAVEDAEGPVGGFFGDAILNTGLLEEAAYGWSQGDWTTPMGITGKAVNGVGMVAGVVDAGVNVATLGVKAMVVGLAEKLGRESLEAALKGVVKEAAYSAGASSRFVLITERQLQKVFGKHGADFGMTGNWNPSRATEVSAAINKHINAPGVQQITGTYRGNPVTHFVDPKSGLNVFLDSVGNFGGGWKLGADQLKSVLEGGKLF